MSADAHRTSFGVGHRKMAMWVFIASECMFFGSLIATYLAYEGRSQVGPTPQEILNIPLTSVSTFVLLMSSLSMVLALDAVQRDERGRAKIWTAGVVVLGGLFLAGQVYEFNHFHHQGLTLQTNLFGATFYVLTGFHGAHVTVGVIWMSTLLVLMFAGRRGPERALDVEVAGLYWHFVDVVWIVIFTLVYLIQ
ncbi:MAG TPA: cytochrome c oxidase subunit 3 [Gemmatimonadota bacterium]|nr:cytochrome c oxidase subunit 3 [Gemmatimonadota bacterium]